MDAVILAAGLGTRLRPYTLTTPKPLLAIQGRPILDWALGALPPEVRRVIVVVHYLAEQIEQYLSTQKHFSAWAIVRQHQPLGTGDALRSCRDVIHSDRSLVLNGDDLYGAADLAQLVKYPVGVLVHPVNEPRRFGIAMVRADGSLERLVEKPALEGTHLANTGAYIFPKDVFDIQVTRSSRGEYEITDYLSALAANRRVEPVRATFWLPIGNVEAWQAAQTQDLESVLSARRT